ncbi:MAG: hypothetical protein HQL87_18750 [Magnetococcales bacterium]|nr:hypothetical protein [Magnetococcales bacterium]
MAGLARANGYAVTTLDEQADLTPLVTTITHRTVLHFALPAVLARHGLQEERLALLQRINTQLLEPLTQRLAATKETLMITSLGSFLGDDRGKTPSVPWVMASGRTLTRNRQFWHRGRLGVGEVVHPETFWSLCAA